MAEILPMFPLGLVAFPGENVNLHIFEPRYKQLIHECEHKHISFCILPYFDGKQLSYATEMKLTEIAKIYDDGKLDIRTQAVGLVRVVEFFAQHPGRLYPGAEVERLPWDEDADVTLSELIIPYLDKLYGIMNIDNVLVQDAYSFKTYQNAHKVGFSNNQELHFLTLQSEKERQMYMLDHLKKFVPVVVEVEELKRKAALNGHFKNLKSRF